MFHVKKSCLNQSLDCVKRSFKTSRERDEMVIDITTVCSTRKSPGYSPRRSSSSRHECSRARVAALWQYELLAKHGLKPAKSLDDVHLVNHPYSEAE